MKCSKSKWSKLLHEYFGSCMTEVEKGNPNDIAERLKPHIDALMSSFSAPNSSDTKDFESSLAEATAKIHEMGVNVLFSPSSIPDEDNPRESILMISLPFVQELMMNKLFSERAPELLQQELSTLGLIPSDVQTIMQFDQEMFKLAMATFPAPPDMPSTATEPQIAPPDGSQPPPNAQPGSMDSPSGEPATQEEGAKPPPGPGSPNEPPVSLSSVNELEKILPGFKWSRYMDAAFAPSKTPLSKIRIQLKGIPPNFTQKIASLPPHLMQQYLVASLIRHYKFEIASLSENPQEKCFQLTSRALALVTFRVFTDKFAPPDLQARVKDVTEKIRTQLRISIRNVKFLDEETRSKALEKEQKMKQIIGLSDWTANDANLESFYGPLKVDPGNFIETLVSMHQMLQLREYESFKEPHPDLVWLVGSQATLANALYEPHWNQIRVEASFMQLPLINPVTPAAIHYGQIGVVLGHEFTHGFDSNGRLFDADGNKADWWSDQADKAFNDEAKCFVDTYSNFPGIPTPGSDQPTQVNGTLTLGENIADNGGINLAFSAFQEEKKQRPWPLMKLPGVDRLTEEQLFFLAFGQMSCNNEQMPPETGPGAPGPPGDPGATRHAPSAARVNGAVMNSADFAKAFNCPAGSPMNPADKCKLW